MANSYSAKKTQSTKRLNVKTIQLDRANSVICEFVLIVVPYIQTLLLLDWGNTGRCSGKD